MYDVVLLVEQELSEPDAKRVVALHEEMPERVRYHVVVPCQNAEAGVEASLGALGTADLYGVGIGDQHEDLEAAQRAMDDEASGCTDRSVQHLHDLGQEAEGTITHDRPVDALIDMVKKVNGQEVIILTRSHLRLQEALDRIESELGFHSEVRYFAEFARASKRGVIR